MAAQQSDLPDTWSQGETCWWHLERVDPNQILIPNPQFSEEPMCRIILKKCLQWAKWSPSWVPGPVLELKNFTFRESLWNIQCFRVFVSFWEIPTWLLFSSSFHPLHSRYRWIFSALLFAGGSWNGVMFCLPVVLTRVTDGLQNSFFFLFFFPFFTSEELFPDLVWYLTMCLLKKNV